MSLCFFLLGAEFLGAAQLIVYVGGTLVLLVFGGMLTAGGPRAVMPPKRWEWAAGGLLAVTLFALLATVSLGLGNPSPPQEGLPGTASLGLAFLGIPEKPGRGVVPAAVRGGVGASAGGAGRGGVPGTS